MATSLEKIRHSSAMKTSSNKYNKSNVGHVEQATWLLGHMLFVGSSFKFNSNRRNANII